jgi:trimeric autotransporter adhesin
MSTKTTFKRIALVTVAALGFGVLTSVAPATAAGNSELPTGVAVGTIPAHRAGVASNTPIVINLPSTAAAGDTIVLGVSLLTAPETSVYASAGVNPTRATAFTPTANTASRLTIVKASSGSGSYGDLLSAASFSAAGTLTASQQYTLSADDSAGQITLRIAFTPDVSGTYTFLVSAPNAQSDIIGLPAVSGGVGGAYYTANSADTSVAYSVTTSAQTTTATLSALTPSPASLAAGTPGQIVKLALGAPLGAGESITVTTTGSAKLGSSTASSANTGTSVVIAASGGDIACTTTSCYFRVDNTVAETVTVTATGSGTLPATVTSALGVTFTLSDSTAPTATAGLLTDDTSIVAASASTTPTATAVEALNSGSTDTASYVSSTGNASHSLSAFITAAPAAAKKTHWTVVDTNGKLTGIAGAVYSVPTAWGATALAAAEVTTTFTGALAITGISSPVYQSFTATLRATVPQVITVAAAAPAASAFTVTNGNRRVAAASTNAITVTLKDQFGAAVSNAAVTVTVAGRNGATASSSIVTDSAGKITYSLTDAGTVGTTDTVSFAAQGATTATATLSYGTTTVTTLDILGPNDTAANTPDTNVTFSEMTGINAAKGGASGTVATVTVTAKDANGVVMAGVPVSFTVAGTTAAILSTKATVYTAADGTASTSVYAWATGSYVVTATAGGKTATSTVYFAQTTATYARTISAVVSGGTITATVKDRYGNVVPNVTVWATKTGTGYFGSGASSTSGATNEAGVVDFYVNGSASVTLSLGSTTAADATYGQSASAAGAVKQGDAASAAVTASAAGTATTAETGVGAAFAPAGINSVTVAVEAGVSEAQTAADAAAEATDAANAATDAANAAAEAADAATAAAQDAADAVAALSTSVSEMINALKKQITSLTNLVIKIQKKVKA